MYDYSAYTFNSTNPLRRLSHRTRFAIALQKLTMVSPLKSVLDYGCGDGFFLRKVSQTFTQNTDLLLVGLEKYPTIYAKTQEVNEFSIFHTNEDVFTAIEGKEKFQFVTILEVLEHCNPKTQVMILNEAGSLLSHDGKIIISVPIEIGIPALVKNIFRFRLNPKRRFSGYSLTNILKSLLHIPIPEYRNKDEYLTHMGFNFRDLEGLISQQFTILEKQFSPFGFAHFFNSQVFFVIQKK